jgi:hypothetical protein
MRAHHDNQDRIGQTSSHDGVPRLRTTHNGTLVAVYASRSELRAPTSLALRRMRRRRNGKPWVRDVVPALDEAA